MTDSERLRKLEVKLDSLETRIEEHVDACVVKRKAIKEGG